MRHQNAFRPFHEIPVDQAFKKSSDRFRTAVDALPDSVLATSSEDELAEELACAHALPVPHLAFDEIRVDSGTRMVPGSAFPMRFGADDHKSYERETYIFSIPYRGDPGFLRCYDSTRRISGDHKFWLERDELSFEIFEFSPTPESIARARDAQLEFLREFLPAVVSAVESYNAGRSSVARRLIRERKEKLREKGDFLAKLGTPVTARAAPPPTLAVAPPVTRRQLDVPSPAVVGRAPDPTLDDRLYDEILATLSKQARAMEQNPSPLAKLGEEDIRDLLLTGLGIGFNGTVTGETFNKSGKTDILLRHEQQNIFVAECKVWKGEGAYLKAITQLLGYLTWRDSKTAILVFVRNRDLLKVATSIATATPTHAEFDAQTGPASNGVSRFKFRIPGTDGATARLAVLLFHLPAG
jgi:hypothetical protein